MRNRTILAIDDDPDIRDLIAQTLADEGYNVVTSGDGRSAIDLATTNPPALILLDLMMPKVSGWQIMSSLKASPVSAEIPVILLSASRDLKQIAQDLGASSYLAKPFDLDDLLIAVAKYVEPSEPGQLAIP